MKGIKTYKEHSVSVSSNEELVLRLFEKAIVSLWEAHGHLQAEDKRSAVHPMQLSRKIFSELLACLDHDEGGELTENLHGLYLWIIREISRSGFEGDADRLEKAIEVAQSIYDGFKEAFSPQEP